MTLRYLLDTTALAEPVKPHANAKFMARLAARLPPGARREALHLYMHDVVAPTLPILAYDEAAAARLADVRTQRERAGRPLASADGQIAAIAYLHCLVVVTANVSDFAGLEGIVVEDWGA